MNHTDIKYVLPIAVSSTTNGATATGNIDRLGYDYCRISVISDSAVVSNLPTTLKVSECDTTVVSNFVDITAFVGGGTGGFTIPALPTAATSITKPWAVFNIDCRPRKRYLKVSITPITTNILTVQAELSRAETTPSTTNQATGVVVSG